MTFRLERKWPTFAGHSFAESLIRTTCGTFHILRSRLRCGRSPGSEDRACEQSRTDHTWTSRRGGYTAHIPSGSRRMGD